MQEFDNWKRTRDYKVYWMEKNRASAQLNTHAECSSFAESVLHQETEAITTSISASAASFLSTSPPSAIQDDNSTPSSSAPTNLSTAPLDTSAATTETSPRFP